MGRMGRGGEVVRSYPVIELFPIKNRGFVSLRKLSSEGVRILSVIANESQRHRERSEAILGLLRDYLR